MPKVQLTINGQTITADDGQSILNAARANDIYIPALCFLTRTSPSMACKLCMVEADGKRVYACNAKVKQGLDVITNTSDVIADRKKIMEIYCINHPLQCGVCDKSGECELQDNVLFQEVRQQMLAIEDTNRQTSIWGNVKYDAGLCIVCKRCISVCKEVIGDDNLTLVDRNAPEIDEERFNKDEIGKDPFGIWKGINKSLIGRKNALEDSCGECGECAAVCPTGALITKDFQYTANAWELESIPSICTHCSGGCALWFETKKTKIESDKKEILRTKNDFHFTSLCAAGRFAYDYENIAYKNQNSYNKALQAFKNAKTIVFNSSITNEEAFILQKLKEKHGFKLYNEEAKNYQDFLANFSKTSGNTLFLGTKEHLNASDLIISLGTNVKSDNPSLKFSINMALRLNKASCLYFHPVQDLALESMHKSLTSVVHKPLEEENIVFLLMHLLSDKTKLSQDLTKHIESLMPTGFIGLDEEKLAQFEKTVTGKKTISLIAGEDLLTHPAKANIARLLGILEQTSDVKIIIVPPRLNSLGVSLICELDSQIQAPTIGYNEKADFTLTNLGAKGDNALDMPSLNQQEGTVVNLEKRLVVLNAALDYKGFSLGDLALDMGLDFEYTAQLTKDLPQNKGFLGLDFDELHNEFLKSGVEDRGYYLQNFVCEKNQDFSKANAAKLTGDLVYRCNPVKHFNAQTARSKILNDEDLSHTLLVSKEFLEKHSLSLTDKIRLSTNDANDEFSLCQTELIGTDIAFVPNYLGSRLFSNTDYRFKSVKIERISL